MTSRLFGLIATFWLLFALLSLFFALALSPMGLRLLLPDTHPVTWVYPALLVLPPVALALQTFLKPKAARLLLWPLAIVLVAFASVLLVLFGFSLLGS